jgi:hypothetical protein
MCVVGCMRYVRETECQWGLDLMIQCFTYLCMLTNNFLFFLYSSPSKGQNQNQGNKFCEYTMCDGQFKIFCKIEEYFCISFLNQAYCNSYDVLHNVVSEYIQNQLELLLLLLLLFIYLFIFNRNWVDTRWQ